MARGDRAGLGYGGERVAATSGLGLRDRAGEKGGDTAVPRWPGSGCPKEHLRGIGRWVREAGLGTQTGREAERGQG